MVYRWAEKKDRERVLDCLKCSYPKFTGYYQNSKLYAGQDPERVLLAEMNGTVCGALLISGGIEQENIGRVGCPVTRPEYRCRGIATRMVQMGTGYLKSLGLSKGFLGYTYAEIVSMYQQSGYQVCMKYI